MRSILVLSCVGVLASCGGSGGHPKELIYPPSAKVPWNSVCGSYDNCGAAGTLVKHLSANTPLFLPSTPGSEPPVAMMLGNLMNPKQVYAAPRICKGNIREAQYEKTLSIHTVLAIDSDSDSKVGAKLKAALSVSVGAELKGALDTAIDRAVKDSLSGKYEVETRTYTLKPDALADRKTVCGAQTADAAVLYSISVLTISGAAQEKLQQSLEAAIKADESLKAISLTANANEEAIKSSKVAVATETAVQSVAMVVSLGFDLSK
jgi:hypothetical protein